MSKEKLLSAYFLAAASIFEPERSSERLGWTRTAVLVDAVSAYLTSYSDDSAANSFFNELDLSLSSISSSHRRYNSLHVNCHRRMIRVMAFIPTSVDHYCRMDNGLLGCLLRMLDLLALEAYPSPPTTHSQIRVLLCRAVILLFCITFRS